MSFFVKGIAVGLVIAAPVGPIGVLCVRRTLAHGRLAGLLSGLGAAIADGFYGFVAAFGIAAVSEFLIGQITWLRLFGGLVLCLIGLRTYLAEPARERPTRETTTLLGAFGSTFVLTLTNPITIIAFVAIFASLGLGVARASYAAASALVFGVFLGSALWWLGVSGGVAYFRGAIRPTAMRWINRASGALIGGFGITALFFALNEIA